VDKTIKQKLANVERMAGRHTPGVFIIDENGKIISSGREYTREQYEAIAKKKRVVTIIDNIKEVQNGSKEAGESG
jgi:hypothetical protein